MKHRIIAIAICFAMLAATLVAWLLAGLRMMSLARTLLVMFTRPAEKLLPEER